MGFIGDLFGGGSASSSASGEQLASTKESIDFQKQALAQVRSDLTPFREAGANEVPSLVNLVNDPNVQRNTVMNSPFYNALADDAKNKLFNNAAATGKVGSGGTAAALQKSILLLGEGLLTDDYNRKQGIVSGGQSAATGTGQLAQNATNNISDLITEQGNIRAENAANQSNAMGKGISNLVSIGASLYGLSDRRAKNIIKKVGELANGLALYLFKYKGDDKTQINVMAQDVEKIMPEAVREIGGLKYINMEMVYGR